MLKVLARMTLQQWFSLPHFWQFCLTSFPQIAFAGSDYTDLFLLDSVRGASDLVLLLATSLYKVKYATLGGRA